MAGGPATPGAGAAAGGAPANRQAPARRQNEVEADEKRRAAEQAAEAAAIAQRAQQVASGLPFVQDELGILVSPEADLSEPELLAPFVVSRVEGDLPNGLPRDLTRELQGKRIDLAVRVEFLSEVFRENKPLSRPLFDEQAEEIDLDGTRVKVLEVLAPRIGHGLLLRRDGVNVFVSRKRGMPLPADLLRKLLG